MHPFGSVTALIGHTGFVGSNLSAAHPWTHRFNSKNIGDIVGQSFDTIVCAGVQAVKYWANQHPTEDWQGIEALLHPLRGVKAKRFVLLSTIDVYPSPLGVTEAELPTPENHAYGRHRLAVEQSIAKQFEKVHIIRLPGLFGPGIKKNVIYDLLHRNCLDAIQPASAFQYYHLKHLGADILKVMEHDLSLLNLATEPIQTQTILDALAPDEAIGANAGGIGRYDFRSLYAHLWGGRDGYLYDAASILAEMTEFFKSERARPA
jgi:nucleoside-diphosphate-sugar epimerase